MGFPTSIPIQSKKVAVTAATNKGVLTFASNAGLYPGTFGTLSKTDGSASVRVMLVKLVGSTQVTVRRAPDATDTRIRQVSYGLLDVSTYNAASTLYMDTQTAPVNPNMAPREIG